MIHWRLGIEGRWDEDDYVGGNVYGCGGGYGYGDWNGCSDGYGHWYGMSVDVSEKMS